MNRIEFLLHQLDHAYDKEGWFPPLEKVLTGVTAAQANWRATGEAANTIWETVNHLLYYKERDVGRLKGVETANTVSTNDDTFAGAGRSDDEDAWQTTVARVRAVHQELRELLAGQADEAFDRAVGNSTLGIIVSNLIMHDVNHTGQIVQIRKLQGSWPARTAYE